jgi:hypothetical protein
MAVRITYCCPQCQSDINSQYWLPPTSWMHVCKHCGAYVKRSGASIRSAWASFFFLAGFVPAWIVATFFSMVAMRSLGGICVGFIIALFVAAIPMQITGWIVGAVVALAADSAGERYSPRFNRDPYGSDYDDRSAGSALGSRGLACPHCDDLLTPEKVAGGWCETCGKKLPEHIRAAARRLHQDRD